MYPSLNIGPFALPTAALVILIGIWVCLWLAERTARRLDLDVQAMSALVTWGLVAGFVGARLTFVGLYWSAYQDNLLGIIWPINSGYNWLGGLFFGAAAMFFYGRYKQLPPAPYLDALAPVFVTGLAFVSLADFLGGSGFGTNTNLPWGINSYGIRRHPVQLYEIGTALLALAAWSYFEKRQPFEGQLFLITTAVYSFGRLLVDPFRATTWITSGGWHGMQIICLLATLAALLLLMRSTPDKAPAAGG
ncbi:MAG: prolipoprotein diacylglyceryl transferase [Candidatus Promineifilaceae bacterium]|jgi:phosphatidylglycerol---prolipoprotein diacylglyceryl transferase